MKIAELRQALTAQSVQVAEWKKTVDRQGLQGVRLTPEQSVTVWGELQEIEDRIDNLRRLLFELQG